MTVKVELTKEEEIIAKKYAESLGISIQEAMKNTFLNAVEDYFDVIALEKGLLEHKKNSKTYSLEELLKEIDA